MPTEKLKGLTKEVEYYAENNTWA